MINLPFVDVYLFIVHHSSFIIHHSLLIAHC